MRKSKSFGLKTAKALEDITTSSITKTLTIPVSNSQYTIDTIADCHVNIPTVTSSNSNVTVTYSKNQIYYDIMVTPKAACTGTITVKYCTDYNRDASGNIIGYKYSIITYKFKASSEYTTVTLRNGDVPFMASGSITMPANMSVTYGSTVSAAPTAKSYHGTLSYSLLKPKSLPPDLSRG